MTLLNGKELEDFYTERPRLKRAMNLRLVDTIKVLSGTPQEDGAAYTYLLQAETALRGSTYIVVSEPPRGKTKKEKVYVWRVDGLDHTPSRIHNVVIPKDKLGRKKREFTQEEKARARQLHDEGITIPAIAEDLHTSCTKIVRILNHG